MLIELVKRHQLILHAYADDTQIYGFCRPTDSAVLSEKISVCVDEVTAWMAANRLQLNHPKTEVLWCSSSRRQHQITADPVCIGNTNVLPVRSVRDLGVYIDADVTMMSLPSSSRVLPLCVESGACGVYFHVTPY